MANTRDKTSVIPTRMSAGFGRLHWEPAIDSDLAIVDLRAVNATPAWESQSDASLVQAACEGDRSAFGNLYARHAAMVHGILLARVPAGEVDDLVQDVFLKAMPRLRDLRDASRFGPWIATIARNRANDFHRKTRPVAIVTESLPEDEREVPDKRSSSTAEAALLLEIVKSLPDAYRETLILRLVEGMTGPEIAARTGLTPGSVRVNLYRGMQQLREKLGKASASNSERDEPSLRRNSAAQQKSNRAGGPSRE